MLVYIVCCCVYDNNKMPGRKKCSLEDCNTQIIVMHGIETRKRGRNILERRVVVI